MSEINDYHHCVQRCVHSSQLTAVLSSGDILDVLSTQKYTQGHLQVYFTAIMGSQQLSPEDIIHRAEKNKTSFMIIKV